MAKKKTLEEFIREYVDKKISDGEAMTVGDFTINSLSAPADAEAKRQRALASAMNIDSRYGVSAEHLASAGLQGGGYADYLSSLADKKRKDALNISAAKKSNTAGSYSDYLSKHVKDATGIYEKALIAEEKARADVDKKRADYEKLKTAVSDKILKDEIINFKNAYSLAVKMGLDRADAETVANEASKKAHDDLRLSVLEKIILNDLTSDKALAYAMSRGLTEDDADMLAAAAKEINEDIKNEHYAKSYLDYLREQEALKKQEKEKK